MTVEFSEKTKSELNRIDGRVIISSASNVQELVGGVWVEELHQLNINFKIELPSVLPDTYSDIDIKSITFYDDSGDMCFIVRCEDDETFSYNKNLLTIQFPSTTVGYVAVEKTTEDLKLLESYSLDPGENPFTSDSDSVPAALDSYYKYVRMVMTGVDSDIAPYLDTCGRVISESYTFRLYTGITLDCAGADKSTKPVTRFGLDSAGGKVKIHGAVGYREYRVKGQQYFLLGEGTDVIESLPGLKLECSESHGFLYEIDNRSKTIIYTKETGAEQSYADFVATYNYPNPATGKTERLVSSTLRLSIDDNNWVIRGSNTSYSENGCPVYLLPPNPLGGYGYFEIVTSLKDIEESDFVISYEDTSLRDLFEVAIELNKRDSGSLVRVRMIAKTVNGNPLLWAPNDGVESNLYSITLLCGPYAEMFYLVQKPSIGNFSLYNEGMEKITEIEIGNTQKTGTYFIIADGTHRPEDLTTTTTTINPDNTTTTTTTTAAIPVPTFSLEPGTYTGNKTVSLVIKNTTGCMDISVNEEEYTRVFSSSKTITLYASTGHYLIRAYSVKTSKDETLTSSTLFREYNIEL